MEERVSRLEGAYEQVDGRLSDLNARFDELRADTNTRFEELRADMNARFAEVNSRLNDTNLLILGSFVAILAALIGLKFL